MGNHVDGPASGTIDVVAILATLFGTTTSLRLVGGRVW
ncbi:hypothetical protein [Saccharopolyspora halophila]